MLAEANRDVHLRHLGGVHQVGDQIAEAVDPDRKPDVLGIAADGGVDPDHLAIDVQQRPAGVARVDGGVGLDQVLERGVALFVRVEVAGAGPTQSRC